METGIEVPSFLPLVTVSLLAFLVPLLSARFRLLPVVVGEILAGILLGKSGLHLIRPDVILTFLSDFGLAYLMFLSGLELDFSQLLPSRGAHGAPGSGKPGGGRLSFRVHPLFLPGAAFLITLILGIEAGYALVGRGLLKDPWLAGFIFATTSLGVVLPILKERRLAGTPYGQALLAYASIADFVTMILITAWAAARGGGGARDILYLFLFLFFFLQIYRGGVAMVRLPLIQRLLTAATGQFDVRTAMAVVLVFIALAERLGVETILGAFLAGAMISLIAREQGEQLRLKLDAIGFGFFVPMFFILFGANLDLWSAITSGRTWVLLPILSAVAYGGKILPVLLFGVRFPLRDALAGGVLLSAQLSLTIAAAGIAQRLGALDEATVSAFLLMAILTSIVSPMLFSRLAAARTEAREVVIVAGDSGLAVTLVERLAPQVPTVLLALGPLSANLPAGDGEFRTVRGTGNAADDLRLAGAGRARALLAVTTEPGVNLTLAEAGKTGFGIENVIATGDPGVASEAAARGVRLITPETSIILLLASVALAPGALDLLAGGMEARLEEVEVRNPTLAGLPLVRCGFPAGVLVVGIRRGADRIVARGDTVLRLHDRAMLMGPSGEVARVREMLSGEPGNPH